MMSRSRSLGVLALVAANLLLWKPTLVVIFPGFLYTSDLTSVFLFDACINCTTQTVLVFCILEVLVACVLLKTYVSSWFFGDRWASFDNLKQRKLVGFLIKIFVRLSCSVQLIFLVSPWFSLEGGLFSEFNIKAASKALVNERKVTTCAEAGMTLQGAVALRAWTFVRDQMMAVMIWELAFIPELPADAWLHHLFVILGVALGSDPHLLASRPMIQPLVDGISFFLVLGAALAALVEAAVLMYHFSAPDAQAQARWMKTSLLIQSALVLFFFLALPAGLVVLHHEHLGSMAYGLVLLLLFLVAVEAKMILVKQKIVKSSYRKALQQSAAPVEPEIGASFNHDVMQEPLEPIDNGVNVALNGVNVALTDLQHQ